MTLGSTTSCSLSQLLDADVSGVEISKSLPLESRGAIDIGICYVMTLNFAVLWNTCMSIGYPHDSSSTLWSTKQIAESQVTVDPGMQTIMQVLLYTPSLNSVG